MAVSTYIVSLALSSLLLATIVLADSSKYVDSVDVFSGRFYKEAANQPDNKGKNIIVSPLSADIVMSMVAFGAQDETRKEITDALAIEDFAAIAPDIQSTITELNDVKGVQLLLANKAFFKASSGDGKLDSVAPTYRTTITDVFKSEVQQLDFSQNVLAADTINKWVESKTNNRIKDLIKPDSLNALTAAVLVNAIYFKGNWEKKFDPSRTQKGNFSLTDGTQVEVDFMNKVDKLKFKESSELDAKIVVLPYENNEVSMVIILPNQVDGIDQLEEKLAGGLKGLDNLYTAEVHLQLPKFKIESQVDVKSVLQNLGAKRVFTSEAQLKGILNEPSDLYISEAVQKAFIEVNEEGAEAAAATGFVVNLLSSKVTKTRTFFAEHPFVFIILSKNAIIFHGAFRSP